MAFRKKEKEDKPQGADPLSERTRALNEQIATLEDQIKKVGGVQNITEENMPEAHIRGDINTQYKCIGAAIITMQEAGFQRVGFISEPPPLTGYRAE